MATEETHAQTTARSDFPKSRWARVALLLAGIIAGQIILYGPSLAGSKVLLPLDLLAYPPNVYLPREPQAEPIVPDNPIRSDLIYAEPYRQFAVEEVRAGRLPIWFPYQFGGCPLNFPVALPSYLLGYVMNSPAAIAWGRAVQALIAGVGAYLFCRRTLALGVWPSIFAGWTFPVTGYMIFWQGYAQDTVVSWLPVLLMALDATMRAKSRWAGAALASATTIVVISGPLDVAGQVLLVSGLYALWCYFDAHFLRWHSRRALLALMATVLGWSLGLLVACPQIWHLLEYSRTGARLQQRSAGSEERPPIGLAALPQTTFPDMYGSDEKGTLQDYPAKQGNHPESSAATYTGLLATLLLAPLAWCSRRHRSVFFFLLFLAFFALSWQLDVPGVVQLLRMPGLNMFSHNRFVFAASFALLAMAAIGMDAVGQGLCRWQRWFWAPVALLAGLCGWFAWSAAALPESFVKQLSQIADGLRHGGSLGWLHKPEQIEQVKQWYFRTDFKYSVLCGSVLCAWFLLWVLGRMAGRAREQSSPASWEKRFRWLLPALAVLQLCDLIWFAYGRSEQSDPALYYPRIPALEQIAHAVPGRAIGYNCLPAPLASTHKLRDVRGYDAVDPRRWLDLMFIAGIPESMKVPYARTQYMVPFDVKQPPDTVRLPPVLDMLGVRYVIYRGAPGTGFHPAIASEDYWVLTNEMALPRVYVPRKVETAPDWEQLKTKMAASKCFLFQRALQSILGLASNMYEFAKTLPDRDSRKAVLLQDITLLQNNANLLEIHKTAVAKGDFNADEVAALQSAARLLRAVASNAAAGDPGKAEEYEEAAGILEIANAVDAKDDFNPREVAYVEVENDNRLDLPQDCRGNVEILEEVPNRIKVSADMQTAGLVVLSDLWDSGWHAYLDGQKTKTPILVTNHAIRGVTVPAGQSTIEFRYEPRSLAWGLPLSGLGLLMTLSWLGIGLRRGNKLPIAEPQPESAPGEDPAGQEAGSSPIPSTSKTAPNRPSPRRSKRGRNSKNG